MTVVHETGNLKKIMFLCVLRWRCPPVLLTASARFHRPEENKQSELIWDLLSICCLWRAGCQFFFTRELRSNGQTRQHWSNMNQYYVTVMPISRLKCFQNHLVVYCLAVKWESLWPGIHVEILKLLEGTPSSAHMTGAQPIGTLSLWNDLWLFNIFRTQARFFKAWKQSHEEVQKSSYISQNTWITICWKVIMEFLPNDAKQYTVYCFVLLMTFQ